MNKKIKFSVIFIGIIVFLMSVFAFPVSAINQGGSCGGVNGTQYCESGKLSECYNNKWEGVENCESGMCTPDNKRCAEPDEVQSIINGTFYNLPSEDKPGVITMDDSTYTPPENDDGSPYGSTSKSGIIPSYGATGFNFENRSIGNVFSGLLPYIYVIAGLILLVMLIMGGLGLMTAAGNPDKMKAGYGKITNALIGFLIIFISYFVVQLVETILGIKIL